MLGKFRVWCNDRNEWERDPIYLSENGTPLHYLHGDLRAVRSDTHKVLFFTGLLDKKGKEIFASDIVKVTHPQGDEPFNGEVFFAPDGMWRHTFLEGRPSKAMWEYAEVIGNIYENPELLK